MADRELLPGGGSQTFTEEDQSAEPHIQAVLAVEGVCRAEFAGSSVTLVRDPASPGWDDLIPRVRYALGAALAAEAGSPAGGPGMSAMDDDEIFDQVVHIFERQINPIVAQHGGSIDLIDVQDATVVVRMSGGCQGCGMANVTLRQGIEAALQRAIPNLAGVRDVTDHSAGSNPYFASTGK